MKNLISFFCIVCLFANCNKDEDKPTACFTYQLKNTSGIGDELTKDTVIFTNCSENATSYKWEFGDGTTSTEVNPTHLYNESMPTLVSLTAYNGSNSSVITDTIWDWAIVYKPNIYLYPEKTLELCVGLNFPKGGHVVNSIPEYADGWCVSVEPSGKINNEYGYLFYESTQPNIWQNSEGWVISKADLSSFFNKNMQDYGFNSNEIHDFIEYWIPLLSDAKAYAIYPQVECTINRVIELEFSIKPKNVNRLFYLIKDANDELMLKEPEIKTFDKTGFYINEWGVVL